MTKVATRVVLDTNVVLDCFLFRDPSALVITAAIESRRWHWIGTQAMADELMSVVDRPELQRWQAKRDSTLAEWAARCELVRPPARSAPAELTCSDCDDQVFIDLAWARQARCLFTRDKALLRLAGRALSFGVKVLRPVDGLAHEIGPPQSQQP